MMLWLVKLFKVELYVEPKKVEEVKPQPVVKEEPEIVEEGRKS